MIIPEFNSQSTNDPLFMSKNAIGSITPMAEIQDFDPSHSFVIYKAPIDQSTYTVKRAESTLARVYEILTRYLLPDFPSIRRIITNGDLSSRFGTEAVFRIADELQSRLSGNKSHGSACFFGTTHYEPIIYSHLMRALSKTPINDDTVIEILLLTIVYLNTEDFSLARAKEIFFRSESGLEPSIYLSMTATLFDQILERWLYFRHPKEVSTFMADVVSKIDELKTGVLATKMAGRYSDARRFFPAITQATATYFIVNILRSMSDLTYARLAHEYMYVHKWYTYITSLSEMNGINVLPDWILFQASIERVGQRIKELKITGRTITSDIVNMFDTISETQMRFTMASVMHKIRTEFDDKQMFTPIKKETFDAVNSNLRPAMIERLNKLNCDLTLWNAWLKQESIPTISSLGNTDLDALGITIISLRDLESFFVPPSIVFSAVRAQSNIKAKFQYEVPLNHKGFLKYMINSNDSNKVSVSFLLEKALKNTSVHLTEIIYDRWQNVVSELPLLGTDDQLKLLKIDMSDIILLDNQFTLNSNLQPVVDHLNTDSGKQPFKLEDTELTRVLTSKFNIIQYVTDGKTGFVPFNLISDVELSDFIYSDFSYLSRGMKFNAKTCEFLYPIRIYPDETLTASYVSQYKQIGYLNIDNFGMTGLVPSCCKKDFASSNFNFGLFKAGISFDNEVESAIFCKPGLILKRRGAVDSSQSDIVWVRLENDLISKMLYDGSAELRPFINSDDQYQFTLNSDSIFWSKRAFRQFMSLLIQLSSSKDSRMYQKMIHIFLDHLTRIPPANLGPNLGSIYSNLLERGWNSSSWSETGYARSKYLAKFVHDIREFVLAIMVAYFLDIYGYVPLSSGTTGDYSVKASLELIGYRWEINAIRDFGTIRETTIVDFIKSIMSDEHVREYLLGKDSQGVLLNWSVNTSNKTKKKDISDS